MPSDILFLINDFKGGLTLNEKMGNADQFANGYGLDFSSKLGYLTCGPNFINMTCNASAGAPTEFQCMLNTIKDGKFWMGGEDTVLYYTSASSIYTSAHNSTADGYIRSLAEYNSYLYYSQDSTIGRKDLTQGTTAGYYDTWVTGLNSNVSASHPVYISSNNTLYAGFGNDVFSWNNSVSAGSALDLVDNWDIRTICDFGYLYLAIGANYMVSTDYSTKGKVFLWNRTDSSWNDEIAIPENSVKAMVYDSGYLWIWGGRSCNLYVVPEGSRKATKMWSFKKENPTADFNVYPNAVCARNGTIYFGLSNIDSVSDDFNPSDVYSFPADPNKFSLNRVILPISEGLSTYDIDIKSIAISRGTDGSQGDLLRIGLNDVQQNRKRVYQEDLATANTYMGTAKYESFRYQAPPGKEMLIKNIGITYDMTSGGTLNLYYKMDADTDWTQVITSHSATAGFEIWAYNIGKVCDSIKLKLEISGAINYIRPFVKSIIVTGKLRNKN